LVLEYVKEQTPGICMAAVSQNGYALQHVKEQTPEICLVAVSDCGRFLRYVKDQTLEICLAAVTNYGLALQYVKEQTPEICLAAVTNCGPALHYVKNQTPEIFLAAVSNCEFALRYVKEQIPDCSEEIRENMKPEVVARLAGKISAMRCEFISEAASWAAKRSAVRYDIGEAASWAAKISAVRYDIGAAACWAAKLSAVRCDIGVGGENWALSSPDNHLLEVAFYALLKFMNASAESVDDSFQAAFILACISRNEDMFFPSGLGDDEDFSEADYSAVFRSMPMHHLLLKALPVYQPVSKQERSYYRLRKIVEAVTVNEATAME
jgi:hypothetical protein